MALRYEVRVLEGSEDSVTALSGPLLGRVASEKEARKMAKEVAMDYRYGVVILDSATGLADWGDGWSDPDASPEDEAPTVWGVRWVREGEGTDQEALVAMVGVARVEVWYDTQPGVEPGWAWRMLDPDGEDGGPLDSADEAAACREALRLAGVRWWA